MNSRKWLRQTFLVLLPAFAMTLPSAADNFRGARPPLVIQGKTSEKRVRDTADQERRYLEEGKKYMESSVYQKAIECYTRVIGLNPTNEEAYTAREDAYLVTGQFGKAFDDECAAINLSQHYPFSYMHWTPRYDPETALNHINSAISKNPKDARAYAIRAMLNKWRPLAQTQYQRLIDDYSKAIELDPGNTNYRLQRAHAHVMEGYYDRALQDYNLILVEDDCNRAAYRGRFEVDVRQRNIAQAVDDAKMLVELDPTNSVAYAKLSIAYQMEGQPDEALGALNNILSEDPSDSASRLKRAYLYISRTEYDKALEDYAVILNRDPSDDTARLARISLNVRLGRGKDAIRDCDALSPKIDGVYWRARTNLDLKNFLAAIADCNTIIARSSSGPDAYYAYMTRAEANDKLGRYRAVIDDSSAALALTVCPNGHLHYLRSKAYGKIGDKNHQSQDALEAERLGYKPTAQ